MVIVVEYTQMARLVTDIQFTSTHTSSPQEQLAGRGGGRYSHQALLASE